MVVKAASRVRGSEDGERGSGEEEGDEVDGFHGGQGTRRRTRNGTGGKGEYLSK